MTNITSTTDNWALEPNYHRLCNVLEVDDAAKTVTVLFGGAWFGLY
jgi:hypothetical protein